MTTHRIAAVAGHFGRDIDKTLTKLEPIIARSRDNQIDLLVFPNACLGGYISDMRNPDLTDLPPGLDRDDRILGQIAAMAPEMVICLGYAQIYEKHLYNAASCFYGGEVIGHYCKIHQPSGEEQVYTSGNCLSAFDTPVGRIGMLIDYDKTFPEAARTLALDNAQILTILSAWPASFTDRAERLTHDRQSRLFDLYDCARAAENQLWVVSSNQTGLQGKLRFLGQAKIVDPTVSSS